MFKTLRISFSLKNTYRVNGILYSLKQIPLVKKLLPETLYSVRGLKIFANILSMIWEVISIFLGKFLYFSAMIIGIGSLYKGAEQDQLFLHMLMFLTIIGSFSNTYMFNPSKDKYYALMLMRMNAREYTLVNYGYAIVKVVIGFLPFSILYGLLSGVPLWQCLMIPFFVAALKLTVSAYSLWDYERTGLAINENKLGKFTWITMGVLLLAAYGLPVIGFIVPRSLVVGAMILSIISGIAATRKILTFQDYRNMYQQILTQSIIQMDTTKMVQEQNQKMISSDRSIISSRKGFEYLNELFIKRHHKILWKASKRIAMVSLCLILGVFLLFYLVPESKEVVNGLLMTYLPYFVFIMYSINRGTGFTSALFMNCDHSLLTYSFYKQPKFVLKLFQIRLREVIKVNLLPATIIGGGLALLLYASGGTDNLLNYGVLFISILCLSIFFSVHYLTIYYLLQPYNSGTEMKSGTYQIVLSLTYMACFIMMNLEMSTLVFGLMTIIFCVAYSIAACILVYKLSPKTFRLRE